MPEMPAADLLSQLVLSPEVLLVPEGLIKRPLRLVVPPSTTAAAAAVVLLRDGALPGLGRAEAPGEGGFDVLGR